MHKEKMQNYWLVYLFLKMTRIVFATALNFSFLNVLHQLSQSLKWHKKTTEQQKLFPRPLFFHVEGTKSQKGYVMQDVIL